jgi:PEGA domain
MAFWPQEAAAQRRAVRRPATRPVVVVSPRYFYRPYYRPFFYPPLYYGSFYSPYYFGLYGQYPYPPYGYRVAYDRTGSARIQVTPREAEVFVDGYFVGVVDDFDGYLQRLHVEAGEHELQFHLEGYRTIRQKVLFTPGTTLKITHAMEPLGPGEASEPRPVPDEASRVQNAPGRRESRQYGRARQSELGTLSLSVQPADAVVLIDGEEWDRPEGESRFLVDLAEGPHRLEVRKEGFKPYTRTIEVRRGQTVTLNVSLTIGGVTAPAVRSSGTRISPTLYR